MVSQFIFLKNMPKRQKNQVETLSLNLVQLDMSEQAAIQSVAAPVGRRANVFMAWAAVAG